MRFCMLSLDGWDEYYRIALSNLSTCNIRINMPQYLDFILILLKLISGFSRLKRLSPSVLKIFEIPCMQSIISFVWWMRWLRFFCGNEFEWLGRAISAFQLIEETKNGEEEINGKAKRCPLRVSKWDNQTEGDIIKMSYLSSCAFVTSAKGDSKRTNEEVW